ncbi:MAG: transcription elongation factor subunit Spt4 [Candidatus Wukongarchaeota archaeon]
MVKSCRTCRRIVEAGNRCPHCRTHTLSEDWDGLIIIADPENSYIAKLLGITEPGKYALRVR